MNTSTVQTTAERHGIPAPCCAPGNAANGDLNRDWACARTARIYTFGGWADDIDSERVRAAKLRNLRRAANLAKWADDAEARLGRMIEPGIWNELACTGHGDPVPCGPLWGQWTR